MLCYVVIILNKYKINSTCNIEWYKCGKLVTSSVAAGYFTGTQLSRAQQENNLPPYAYISLNKH